MAKSKKTFDIPEGVDPSQYLEQLKAMAEENLSKAKETYEQAQAAFADAQKEAEAGLNTVQEHSSKISLATLDAVRSNTETTLSHMEKLVGVKSLSEFMESQTAFIRQQAEMAAETAKSMQKLYQSAANDAAEPVKKAAEKALDAFNKK